MSYLGTLRLESDHDFPCKNDLEIYEDLLECQFDIVEKKECEVNLDVLGSRHKNVEQISQDLANIDYEIEEDHILLKNLNLNSS